MLREEADQGAVDTTRLPRVASAIILTGPLRRALEQEPAITVLCTPRGFGKTSAVASWIRGQNQARTRYVWVASPMRATSRQEFWAEVYRALTGSEVPEPADPFALVHARLQETLQPTTLVVDNFTYVTDEAVDDELGELTNRFTRVRLVVMIRMERAIVAIANAHAEGIVLRMPDLGLDAASVAQMAATAGYVMAPEQAAEIARAVAGWPAVIRGLLRDGTRDAEGGLVPDWHGIERYCRIVLDDPDMQRFTPLLIALSAAEEFDADLGQSLIGEDAWRTAFPVILQAGIIDHWQHQSRDHYRIRPRLRAAVQAVTRRHDPVGYRRYHRMLADWHDHRENSRPALFHAVEAEEWEQAAAVMADYWLEIVTDCPLQARQMLRKFPEDIVRASATLLVARDFILNVDTAARAREAFRSGQMAADFSTRYENQRLTLSQTLQLRVSGQYEAFRQVMEETGGSGERSAWADTVLEQMPELLLQWSITTLLTNDLASAAYTFRQAYRWARERQMSGAKREAGSGLALCLAILGHLEAAQRWLDLVAGLPAGPAAADLEQGARLLVSEIVAGDRLQPTDGRDRARYRPTPALPGLEVVHQYINAAYALHQGNAGTRTAALSALERTVLNLTPGRHGARITGAVARSAIVDMCIATEDFERAHRTLRGVDEDQAWVIVCRSRLALYEGQYEKVLDLTAGIQGISVVDVRHGVQLHLLRACAALRMDRMDVAGDNLQEAVSLADHAGIVRPFVLVPRVDLLRLDEQFAHVLPAEIRTAVTATEEIFGAPREPVRLSAREDAVLRQIATGAPLSQAARRLYVSENTIKSQVRNIYRKLGVHSREDALERATALGLLPEPDGDHPPNDAAAAVPQSPGSPRWP